MTFRPLLSRSLALLAIACLSSPVIAEVHSFTLSQALSYPFESELTAAESAPTIAWVRNLRGARNIWVATGPEFTPRQLTTNSADDGQELTQPTFSPDGRFLVFVRGGDHDANWPAKGNLPPNPDSSSIPPEVAIWSAPPNGGNVTRITDGDAPAISAKGTLAHLKDHQVWTAPLDGKGKPERLFFDRGDDSALTWSPDGSKLAFVSNRGGHAFIGIFRSKSDPVTWMAPSTSSDSSPCWSPDSQHLAFIREQGDGGPPDPWLKDVPRPFSIWTASAATGAGQRVWQSPDTPEGSRPEVAGFNGLFWGAGDRLVFLAELDGWEHLYSVPVAGTGPPLLLTPGTFMVEDVTITTDHAQVIYSANSGPTDGDGERRHLFATPIDRSAPRILTTGESLEWRPVVGGQSVAFIAATATTPPGIGLVSLDGAKKRVLNDGGPPPEFPADDFITPKSVSFTTPDGLVIHGQLFQRAVHAKPAPGVIFLHGGPPRQMMLGWHYMDYYSNAYAMNQYLAAHGFAVLTINYRLGIGYGRAFQHPEKAGPRGASEYLDVIAGAHFLQATNGVDPNRIGIWGGSYGGYLTGLALARNSETFKAGVDLHGVHDWSQDITKYTPAPYLRYEQGDHAAGMETAFKSSPDADIATWRSPVLLIQGDDDRNVDFSQTVDLARRLEAQGVRFEELVLPDEIHGFLRHESWLKADSATAGFLARELKAEEN